MRDYYIHPLKNATRIDLSRAIDVTATTMATDGVLNVSFTPSQAIKGIAFYNEDTLEFLLAYINDFTAMAQSVNMYYRVDDIGNGGQNVAMFVSLILQMDGLISTSNHDQDELIGDIHYYTLADTTEIHFCVWFGKC